MKKLMRMAYAAFVLTILNHPLSAIFGQGTAFTYQGHLNAEGAAANGSYDLQFTLYTVNAGGVALAGPVTNSATVVSNGLFTTAIDFGPGVFVGESNWLDIAVRTNNGGAFTELAPRQAVLPTPYAIYAESAATAADAGSVAANNISGTVRLAQLPTALVTNNATGLVLSGTFLGNFGGTLFGNGAGLTALTPANLSAGTAAIDISGNAATATTATTATNVTGNIADTQLSANIARLNGTNVFSGTNTFNGIVRATNTQNVIVGAFTGNGGGLTNVNVSQIAGILPLSDLPAAVVTNGETGVSITGSFAGDGMNVSNVDASTLNGLNSTNLWQLGGNSGTTPGANYVGTSDNETLELHVDGERALQLIPDANNEGAPDFVGGSAGNYVAPGVVGAVVDGGATNYTGGNLFEFTQIDYTNSVLSDFSVVAGGVFNTAGAGGTGGATVSGGANNNAVNAYATVGGGENNNAIGLWSAIGGGNGNTAQGSFYGSTVVAGGSGNTAGTDYATVGGGSGNQAMGFNSTVPGGANNLASGRYSFAAGQEAEATNTGAFVWADSQNAVFTSTNNDSFNVRAQGGARFVTSGAGLTVDGLPVLTSASALNASQLSSGTVSSSLLTSVPAASLTGTVPLAQLPSAVITNNERGLLTVNSLSVSATNQIAPLTITPNIPSAAIGSVGTLNNSKPYSIAISGRYAYVVNYLSGGNNLQIFDVSTPASPVSVGSATIAGIPSSVAVAGRYAYVTYTTTGNFLQIFDVSDPASPALAGSATTGTQPECVAVSGRYAYVVNQTGFSLQIFDVNNPASPVLLSTVTTGASSYPQSVAVAGRYAYVANSDLGTLQIFDVNNPTNPVSVHTVSTGSSPSSVAVSGRYAYVTDVGFGNNDLQIFDVSNPANPASVGSVSTGPESQPYSVVVAGRYAYVADYGSNTLQIIDVSSPATPVSVGTISTGAGSGPFDLAVSGRYAYEGNNTSGGMQVFDLGGEYVQQLEAGAVEIGSLQTRDSVMVGNSLNVRGGLTVSASARISGGLGADSITATNFNGNGSGLTNLSAGNLTGTVPLAQLPGGVITNTETGITLSGSFTGTLAGNTSSANAAATAGLATNVVLGINITNAFVTNSSFAGDGSGLTNLNASKLNGSVPSSVSVPSGDLTGALPAISGANLTNLNAAQLTSIGAFGDFFLGSAGNATTSGQFNTGSGLNALASNTSGADNTATGSGALHANTTGSENTAIGINALHSNMIGSTNVAIGSGALVNNSSGSNNIAIGYDAGVNITTTSSNIDIGNTGVSTDANIIRVGTSQTATYLVGNVFTPSGTVESSSDRNAKEDFAPVNPQTVLAKIASLPVTEWNYKTAKDVEHIGPMAQDFHAAFGLNGTDDKHISVVDEGGVALAAIQGLNQKVDEKDAKIQQQDAEIADLEARLDKLEQLVSQRNKDGQ